MDWPDAVEQVGKAVDALGVAVIIGGVLLASITAFARLRGTGPVYVPYRRALGRAILLGLEVLVAADIIRTVAVAPTLESVAVLAVIVGIRTVLSFTLEVELEGRWPWQASRAAAGDERPDPPRPSGS